MKLGGDQREILLLNGALVLLWQAVKQLLEFVNSKGIGLHPSLQGAVGQVTVALSNQCQVGEVLHIVFQTILQAEHPVLVGTLEVA